MRSTSPVLSFVLMMVSGWVHRHQLIVIEFPQAENRLLKDRLRGRRIRFTDAERALLARKAKTVGRRRIASHLSSHFATTTLRFGAAIHVRGRRTAAAVDRWHRGAGD